MKKFFFIPIFVLIIGCSGSDYPNYEKYTPKFEGQFVNSEKILQAWYPIPKEFTRDSIKNWFGIKYLGKDISELNSINLDSGKMQVIPVIKDSLTVYLINTDRDTIFDCTVQDGSLMMVQQAKDTHGSWKTIESWVSSTCGNSLALPSNTYISVNALRYKGKFKTEMRFLFYFESRNKRYKIYSESFWGSVNLSQFERPDEVPFYIIFFD
jgi:hypothetical protein